jgi:hypothetical protein
MSLDDTIGEEADSVNGPDADVGVAVARRARRRDTGEVVVYTSIRSRTSTTSSSAYFSLTSERQAN